MVIFLCSITVQEPPLEHPGGGGGGSKGGGRGGRPPPRVIQGALSKVIMAQ